MRWEKLGRIFSVENHNEWMQTHSQVPVVDIISDETLRIYFGTRDRHNRTRTTFIEVDAKDPRRVTYIHNAPLLPLGEPGCFDDSGVMPTEILNYEGSKYLYYIGWNVGIPARYRLSIGLAISKDGGVTFQRFSQGPIMDRSPVDPIGIVSLCITIVEGIWRMWYASFTKWEEINGVMEPWYKIKYAESFDGINWKREGIIAIDFKSEREGGIAKPTVLYDGKTYRMWFCYRGISDYRQNISQSYRIGYAESTDGINWVRKDEEVGIDVSPEGWDSEMICYPDVVETKWGTYMFYNGNGFGKSGIGVARLV